MYSQFGMQPFNNHSTNSKHFTNKLPIMMPSQMVMMPIGFPNGVLQMRSETNVVQFIPGKTSEVNQEAKITDILNKLDQIIEGMLEVHPKKSINQKGANILKEMQRVKILIDEVLTQAKSIPVDKKLNMDYTNYLMYVAQLQKQILDLYNSLIMSKQKGECKVNPGQARELKGIVEYVREVLLKEVEDIEKAIMETIKKQGGIIFERRTQDCKQILRKDCFQ